MAIMKRLGLVGLYIILTAFGIGIIAMLGVTLAIAIMSGLDILFSIVIG